MAPRLLVEHSKSLAIAKIKTRLAAMYIILNDLLILCNLLCLAVLLARSRRATARLYSLNTPGFSLVRDVPRHVSTRSIRPAICYAWPCFSLVRDVPRHVSTRSIRPGATPIRFANTASLRRLFALGKYADAFFRRAYQFISNKKSRMLRCLMPFRLISSSSMDMTYLG